MVVESSEEQEDDALLRSTIQDLEGTEEAGDESEKLAEVAEVLFGGATISQENLRIIE